MNCLERFFFSLFKDESPILTNKEDSLEKNESKKRSLEEESNENDCAKKNSKISVAPKESAKTETEKNPTHIVLQAFLAERQGERG